MTSEPTCPVCDETIEDRESTDAFPFCSSRCKEIDLGRWLGEQYTIPITPRQTERRLPQEDDARSDRDD